MARKGAGKTICGTKGRAGSREARAGKPAAVAAHGRGTEEQLEARRRNLQPCKHGSTALLLVGHQQPHSCAVSRSLGKAPGPGLSPHTCCPAQGTRQVQEMQGMAGPGRAQCPTAQVPGRTGTKQQQGQGLHRLMVELAQPTNSPETVPETLIAVAGEVGLGDTGLHRGGCATYRVRMGKQRGCIRHPCPGTAPEASSQQQGRASSDARRGWTGSASSSVRLECKQGLNTEQAAPARGPSVANLPPPALQQYSSQPVPVIRCYSSVRLLLFNYFISFLFFCLVISIEGEIKCSRW